MVNGAQRAAPVRGRRSALRPYVGGAARCARTWGAQRATPVRGGATKRVVLTLYIWMSSMYLRRPVIDRLLPSMCGL